MPRFLLFALTQILLILTVPWFHDLAPEQLFGLPSWVVLSFFVTLIYALTIALLLQYYWPSQEEGA